MKTYLGRSADYQCPGDWCSKVKLCGVTTHDGQTGYPLMANWGRKLWERNERQMKLVMFSMDDYYQWSGESELFLPFSTDNYLFHNKPKNINLGYNVITKLLFESLHWKRTGHTDYNTEFLAVVSNRTSSLVEDLGQAVIAASDRIQMCYLL